MALAVFCVWWLVYSREEIHKEYIRFGDQWIALSFKKYIHRYLCKPDLHREDAKHLDVGVILCVA